MPSSRDLAVAVLREPLVHFLVAGALVFLVLSGRPPNATERRIVVDEPVLESIFNRYVQSFHRPPTPEEIDGLVQDYIRSEVYYREALRLGLDRDDEVVKKRMRNKMLALSGAEAEATQPSDTELQALLDKDPARYAAPPRFTLQQHYLGADTPTLRAAAQAAIAAVKPGSAPDLPTVTSAMPDRVDDASPSDLAAEFGDEFAESVSKAPVGRWTGPVLSGFGLHVIKIERLTKAPPPRLEDVRQSLENDWRFAAVRKAEDESFKSMLRGYDVVIERPR
ncbi:MAG: peptidyl-prolyl cis-trans isomerase [Sphingomonadales bacterium]|nr:peptidyl-prolyl cis-trans isomerase [Sphingomonadales bacterium]